MAKKDLQYRIDQVQSQTSVSSPGGGSGGSGLSGSMIGLRDDDLASINADPYGYIQLIGQDSSMEVTRLNTTQMGFRARPAGIDHNSLANLATGHPHTQYVRFADPETITGLWTFDRSTNAPFAVNSGAAKVVNLNSDKLDGLDSVDFLSPQYLTLAVNGNLTNERVLTPGDGLSAVDSGAGGAYTLKVGQGTLLSVGPDDVGISNGANYQFIGTGSGVAATWRNVSELAGNGLSSTNGILAVNFKEGIEIDTDSLRVDEDYSFTWEGTHTFQTNDVQMDVNLDFVGPQSITTSSGKLTISPSDGHLSLGADLDFTNARSITTTAGDLTLAPYTSVLIPGTKILGSTGVMSGQTVIFPEFDSSFPIAGWRIIETSIDGQSGLTIGAIAADELRVKVFVADETRVDRGDEYWTKSYGILAAPFATPAIGATITITVEDSPAVTGAVFANNDWVLFRKIDVTLGLTVASLWGQVSSYVDNNDDTQSWTYTHRSGPVGMDIKKGDIAIDFGTSGAALIHLSVNDLSGAPFIKMRRWVGDDPYSPINYTTYVQIGNLGSVGNALYTPTGDGLYIRSTASAGKFLVADNLGLQIRGADLSLWNGASEVFKIDSTAISLALGANRPTGYAVHDEVGVWMGLDGGAYKFSLGSNTQYLRWDGTNLSIAGSITITNPGDMGWIETFYSSTAPGAGGTGDLWFDTDDGNKMYRHSGTDWVEIQDDGIGTALSTLSDMASDNLLTPVEKPSAIRDYDVIIAEQAGIDAQATSFAITTTKIAYDTAISDLTSYLATLTTPVLWSNLSGNTTVVGTTFRTNFQTVYTARQAVLDAITAKAKVLVETAQADAGTALGKLADIASDSYLTPNEKPSVILNRDVIRDEQAGIDAQALSYSVSTTTYDDAVSALTAYLATLTTPVAWDTLTDKTEIVGTTFRSKFSDVYIARQAVLDAIVAATRTIFNDIASDNVLTPVEKPIATREYNAILAEQTTLDAQAASYGVSSASYDTKVSNLTTYLTVTITGFSSLTTNTTIDGPTFRTKFEEVYSARQALQTAIVAAAKALADSKIKTSYQAAPGPSSGNSIGDLWVDTTDYVTYRWSGSAWVATSPLSNRTPTGSGLFISATHMGYYAAGNWNTYIGSNGTMWMRGATEPTPTNGMQGLWWEPGTPNRLHIYGDIYLNNSSGSSGGNSYGPQLNISEYGLISMGKNGTFEMHDGDTPTPSVQVSMSVDSNGYSDVTFGSTEGPGYLNFDGETGELTIMGKIIVTDGGDFQPAWYRPVAISASFDRGTFGDPGEEEPALVSAPPYEVGEGIAGRLEMADGSDFYLLAGGSTCILTVTGSRFFKVCILKDIEFLFPDGHIANPVTTGGYNNVVYVFVYSLEEWAALNPTQLANRIVIADAYLSADFSELITLTMRADSSLSIITPDFIRTPHLEALSIQMGHLQGGKITLTNGANTLWFNDGTDDVVLAAGTTAGGVNGAAFKLWENGNFAAGNNDSHISWANPTLYIKGTIQATAGYLNGLTVDGNLTMNGGQIRWNSNNSYIDNSKIVISETNGYSITRIGDIGQLGLIDIDMFHTGLGAWRHGIHITDGGNSLENVSSLYHAMTEKGDDAVDRLYNAIASNDGTPGSESLNIADGYYADIAGGVSSDWASKGVAFKGETDVAPAIVVQRIGTGIGPTVWASGNQESAAVFVAFAGSSNMTAFYVSKTQGALGTIALNTGGGDVNMLDGLVRFTVKSSAASVSSADSGQAKMYIKDNGGQPYIVIKYPNGTEHWFARSFTM